MEADLAANSRGPETLSSLVWQGSQGVNLSSTTSKHEQTSVKGPLTNESNDESDDGNGTTAQRHNSTTSQGHKGTTAQRHSGTTAAEAAATRSLPPPASQKRSRRRARWAILKEFLAIFNQRISWYAKGFPCILNDFFVYQGVSSPPLFGSPRAGFARAAFRAGRASCLFETILI